MLMRLLLTYRISLTHWRWVGRTVAGVLAASVLAMSQAYAASDVVRIGMQLEPSSFDTTTTSAATASEITYANIMEGLTYIDGDGEIKPRLALNWTVSNKGRTVDFQLRPNVRYHDGKPFDAGSAAFSLNRMLGLKSGNAYLEWFDKLESVQAVSSHVLRIQLKSPDSLLTYALALPGAVLVHPDSADNNSSNPIGTGPYRMQAWERGKQVRLVRNDLWWGTNKPFIREAVFMFMATGAETENMLAEGRVDALSSVTRLTASFAARTDYVMGRRGVEGKLIVAMNNKRPPFNDIRVRRALSHAIDRSKYLNIYGPLIEVQPIGAHFAPSHPAYVNLVKRYPLDLAKAKQLLADAKVPEGTVLRLAVPPTDYGRYGSVIVASQLEAIGLRIEIIPMTWPVWLDDVMQKKDYDMTLIMHVEPLDLGIYARNNYYFNYDNGNYQKIWEKLRAANTVAEQNQWLGQAQRQMADDAVNLFLQVRPERNFIRKGLLGMWERCPIPVFALENLHWQKP